MAEIDEFEFLSTVVEPSSLLHSSVPDSDTPIMAAKVGGLPTICAIDVPTRPTMSTATTTCTSTCNTATAMTMTSHTSVMTTSAVTSSINTQKSHSLKSVLMKMTQEPSITVKNGRHQNLPPNVVLPKTIIIAPKINIKTSAKKAPSISTVTMSLKPQTTSQSQGSALPPCVTGVPDFAKISGASARAYSVMGLSPGDTNRLPPNSAGLTLTGYPVVINGESGVFLADKMLKNQDVLLKPSTSVVTGFFPPQPKPGPLRRTVGISSEPSVPIEIGLHHKLISPALFTTMDRLPLQSSICKSTFPSVAEGGSQTTLQDFYDFDSFREKYLPLSGRFSYNYTTIDEEESMIQFRISGVTTKEQVNVWVRELENKTTTLYRVAKTFKLIKAGAYKVQLRCHMYQGKRADSSTLKGKDFGCRSMLDISVEPPNLSRGVPNRSVRGVYRCRVRFRFEHNHSLEESLRHMPVRKEVRDKIMAYFEEGLGITDAYARHYQELKQEHGPRYYEIICNRGLCPDKGYFYNIWKSYCLQKHGKILKPPRSVTPKVPWNKGLRGVSSLKEFFPIATELATTDVKGSKKGEPGKKERIRRAALDGIDSTLMASIRQNPETYSKAVACFVEVWRSMDDKERLIWLQTRIENDVGQRVTLVPADHVDESLQAAENILLEEFAAAAEHNYSDIVVTHQELPPSPPPPSKRRREELSQPLAPRSVTEFTFEVSEGGMPFYRVTNTT